MMRPICFILILLNLAAVGQPSGIDSVQKQVDLAETRQEKLTALWNAVKFAEQNDKSGVQLFTDQIQQIAETSGDSALWFEAQSRRAAANRWIGNYSQSIEEFSGCYHYFKQNSDTNLLAFTLNHLGAMHVFMGYNQEAQQYMLEHYELEKKRGDPKKIADTMNGLAIFYSNINQNNKALEHYEEALELYEQANDTLGRANIHANLGLLLTELNRLEEAEHHIMMQGKLDSLLQSQWGLGFFFDFLGLLRKAQGRMDEAYEAHLTALQIRENLESHYNISESRASIASLLLETGKYEEAINEADLIIANKDLTGSLSHQERAYDVLARSHEALGNFKEALTYYKLYKLMSDSILNREMHEVLAEKDAKYELANKQSTIQLLNTKNKAAEQSIEQQRKTILYGAAGLTGVVLLSIVLFALLRKYLRQKSALAVALDQKDLLLREIHHRVKNNLQIVSSLLSLQGRSVTDSSVQQAINDGKSRVRSMALIHQNLYQRENLTGVNVRNYIEKLSDELMRTYLADDDRIKTRIDIPETELDVDTLVPLGLIINELLTNSMKYAFPDNRAGEIRISMRQKSGKTIVEIADNGIGYDPEKVNSNSFGNKLISSLSKQLGSTTELEINGGTLVRLILPAHSK